VVIEYNTPIIEYGLFFTVKLEHTQLETVSWGFCIQKFKSIDMYLKCQEYNLKKQTMLLIVLAICKC